MLQTQFGTRPAGALRLKIFAFVSASPVTPSFLLLGVVSHASTHAVANCYNESKEL